jgi:hypothetical protein
LSFCAVRALELLYRNTATAAKLHNRGRATAEGQLLERKDNEAPARQSGSAPSAKDLPVFFVTVVSQLWKIVSGK